MLCRIKTCKHKQGWNGHLPGILAGTGEKMCSKGEGTYLIMSAMFISIKALKNFEAKLCQKDDTLLSVPVT